MYGVTPDIRVRFTLERDSFVCSGYRPVHRIGDALTTGMHTYFTEDQFMPGTEVDGLITFIAPEQYPRTLEPGMKIPFYEGSRKTGCAEVLEIYNESMRK